MPDSTNPQLDSVVSIANASIRPKILTSENFEVISVQPFKESTSTHNTLVTVKIDLGAAAPLVALPESDRYAKRDVKFTRIDLADIAEFRGIEKNEKGQYILNATNASELAAALDTNLNFYEVERIVIDEDDGVSIFRVDPNSLGWKGQITVVGEPVVPWVCAGNVTATAFIIDEGNNEDIRRFNLRIKVGTGSYQTFKISGTGSFVSLINENTAAQSYLASQDIEYWSGSEGEVYFVSNNANNSSQIEIVPTNEFAFGTLTNSEEQENTSLFINEDGALRFCLAQRPPVATAVTITNDASLTTTSGYLALQLEVTTTPNPAFTNNIALWSITAGGNVATVSETGELMIVDAPDGTSITVRYETINGVFTTKTFTTTDIPG